MPDFGVTNEGFNLKKLDTILSELEAELISVFGDNLDLSAESPDGQVAGIVSESYANLWELAEECYQAFNPSGAKGTALRNLVQLNNITAKEKVATIVEVTITGTVGLVIPSGSIISDPISGTEFHLTEDATISGSGTVDVIATAGTPGDIIYGPINLTANSVNSIDTPLTGWTSVDNASATIPGTFEETDTELRARRKRSIAISAKSTSDSMRANLLDLQGVTDLNLLENDTNAVDSNGVPAYATSIVIKGGLDSEIAQTIFETKPLGSPLSGTVVVAAIDSEGVSHDQRFIRPAEINIYISISLTTDVDFPADGEDQIIQAILDYVSGELVEGRGYSIADDVVYSELYTPINTIPGHQVDSLTIGTTASPTGEINIPISEFQISNFDAARIIIT